MSIPEKLSTHSFPNGLTVRQLKELVKKWPEINEDTGEDCEVWVEVDTSLSSQVISVCPLNTRVDEQGGLSADLLFELS